MFTLLYTDLELYSRYILSKVNILLMFSCSFYHQKYRSFKKTSITILLNDNFTIINEENLSPFNLQIDIL